MKSRKERYAENRQKVAELEETVRQLTEENDRFRALKGMSKAINDIHRLEAKVVSLTKQLNETKE